MLNIPDSVKALYKQDGVRKNFRAHFPGGELPDITNDNIVQESVKFTESICSQDVFKFGLTEASVIEFETVGVANMYGMMIECSSEIDCSSLSAAEIAEIEAGTWDGEFVLLADSDLGFPFFRVPYGVFRVESCPRDHQAMAHRRVTAYTLAGGHIKNRGEEAKLAMVVPTAIYKPDLWLLLMASVNEDVQDGLLSYGFTRTQETPSSSAGSEKLVTLKKTDGTTVQLWFSASMRQENVISVSGNDSERIISIVPGEDYNAIIDEAAAALAEYGIDYEASGYISMREVVLLNAKNSSGYSHVYPGLEYVFETRRGGSFSYQYAGVSFPNGTNAFYAGHTYEKGGISTRLGYPSILAIEETAESGAGTIFEHRYAEAELYSYTAPSGAPSVPLKFDSTASQRAPAGFAGFTFIDAYNINDILSGWLELTAQFAAVARDGTYKIMRIDNSAPEALAPADYSQMWFDEFAVEPIGSIRYCYTDAAEEEQIADYVIGVGGSVYDLTDNVFLKSMDAPTPQDIQAILDSSFIPNLSDVYFVPIDLAAKGLPYIEAGDALTVTAQDGTVCNSYALRRVLNGVQVLSDQIDSESGLIIDSEEGGT